ncbi:MAG: 23S rRNA (pseudouridine(1915)-N(3))-methyltransferase RlmH [Rhodobacteraceae bacterium]|nr:23S rRNA (pseudouridine(1915)-N(3))-methyltransferase RlmH [Paracoccaceae bacterium]TVR48364.1 MAG: 23S rRNA (pseudouridine(1915)-N(3))-methyltransferase RlmH [Paracoccaceae bacterium]
MRLQLCAVGRIRKGPERALLEDYLTRFDRAGKQLFLGPCSEHEIDDRKATSAGAQGEALLRAVPSGAVLLALDERGQQMTSPEFAAWLARARDRGISDLAIVIGGADGLAEQVVARADQQLSLGGMVWPHRLARVMIAEQLYRAATILAGSPYHRT